MPAAKRPRLVHRRWFVRAASRVAAAYLRVVARTTRWEVAFDPATLAMVEAGGPGVAVFWHQRLLGIPTAFHRLAATVGKHDLPVVAIVSRHGDGELIAQTLDRLGVEPIRGSTGRGGAAVALAGRRRLDAGTSVAVVVDGPRGPHGHVHRGALLLAQKSGHPMVPVSYGVARGFQVGSWDRLLVPLPFNRGRLTIGAPIHVSASATAAELEALRLEVGRRLEAAAVADDEASSAVRAGAAAPLGRS